MSLSRLLNGIAVKVVNNAFTEVFIDHCERFLLNYLKVIYFREAWQVIHLEAS